MEYPEMVFLPELILHQEITQNGLAVAKLWHINIHRVQHGLIKISQRRLIRITDMLTGLKFTATLTGYDDWQIIG
jgi:hypothetical protein